MRKEQKLMTACIAHVRKRTKAIGALFLCFLFFNAVEAGSIYKKTGELKGSVRDKATGEPLVGATVVVKGTSQTTITDTAGSFRLDAPIGSVLIVSFVGYGTEQVTVHTSTVLISLLAKGGGSADSVVVIGYGTQKKSDLTGAVGTVRLGEIKQRNVASLQQSLAGRVPGVQVNVNSGRPGGKNNIRIRGFSSINSSNNPLYVVDGVMLPMGDNTMTGSSNYSQYIDYINPNDIESIEILKDASATAIYGARGANGVVLITTKRGKPGQSRVTYDGSFSVPTIGPIRAHNLNAAEFLHVEDVAYANMQKYDSVGWANGIYAFRNPALARTDPRLFDPNGKPLYNTDWLKEATQSKISQDHQIGFNGGKGGTAYSVTLGYRDDEGLIKSSYLRRYSGRFTIDDQVKSWLKIGGTLSYLTQEENLVDQDYLVVRTISEALPFMPVKYKDDSWADNRNYPNAEGQYNPVHYLTDRNCVVKNQNTIGSLFANINVTKELEFRSVLGANFIRSDLSSYTGKSLNPSLGGSAVQAENTNSFWSFENYMTYNKKLGDDHSLTAVLGTSLQKTTTFGFQASASGFSTDYFQTNNLGAGSTQYGASTVKTSYAFNSYFGRINYSYQNKYLLTVTGREDGSSKFGDNNKYAFFPSAAVAWKISEEKFMSGASVISNLKLRASVGVTGNSEIAPYSSLPTLSSNYADIVNDQRQSGTGISRLANPNLKWEKTTQKDLGVELGILGNRINFEGDIYYRKTTDMLLDAPVPTSSGYASITRNIGSMENKGLELSLRTVNVQTRNFNWQSTFNISFNRNKVLSLATPGDIYGVGGTYFISPTNVISVGHPVGSFRGLVRLGVWSTAEAAEAAKFVSYRGGKPILPGDIKYLDVNHDNAITDADRMIIGNGSPKYWGAFINNFTYKDFDLLVDLQYSYGNNVYDLSTGSGEDRVALANSYSSVLNAWTPQHQNTMVPEWRDTRAGYIINEDTHWLKDGSFVRVRNIVLGYTFPTSVLSRLRMNRLRIYGSVQNAFLFCSKALNGDPETVGSTFGTGAFAQGLAYYAYPKPRMFSLGLNIVL
ncbi:MAG: TonB-dependent receptor [Sphingobacteriales bacterium]|nr:TonB-dependent receptor [Sphingobacteriales bacterium]